MAFNVLAARSAKRACRFLSRIIERDQGAHNLRVLAIMQASLGKSQHLFGKNSQAIAMLKTALRTFSSLDRFIIRRRVSRLSTQRSNRFGARLSGNQTVRFFVKELCSGTSVSQAISRRKLTASETVPPSTDFEEFLARTSQA